MKLEIQIEVREGVLLATASGNMEAGEALRLLKQVFNTASEKGIHKILVDTQATDGEMSTTDRFQLGSMFAAHVGQPTTLPRLAIVGKPPTVDGFAVRVAQNRGLSVEVFSSQQDALRWLGSWPS
jgi:hypothetical protein